MQHHRAWTVGMFAAVCLIGCGSDSGPTLYSLSGRVTFEGTPVPYGQIQFLPDTARGNGGPAGFAVIHNGHYDTRDAGKGVVGGPHVVVIDGFDGAADPAAELENGRPLFSSYRTAEEFPLKDAEADFSVPSVNQP